MAYNGKGLTIVFNANGVSLAMYTTTDAKAAVDTTGYFNLAADKLGVGSFLFLACSDGYGIAVVNANASGVVDIADATAIGGTDTD